jgi:hypothetical protein
VAIFGHVPKTYYRPFEDAVRIHGILKGREEGRPSQDFIVVFSPALCSVKGMWYRQEALTGSQSAFT